MLHKSTVKKTVLFLTVFSLLFSVGMLNTAPAWAQDGNCPDGLNEDDCALLEQSRTAMADLRSFNNRFSIDFSFTGGDTPLTFNTAGQGPVVFNDNGDPIAFDFTLDNAAVSSADGERSGSGALRYADGRVFLAETGDNGELQWSGAVVEELTGESDVQGNDLMAVLMAFGADEYVEWSREDDTTVNERPAAVFVTAIPLATVVRSPAFLEQLADLLAQNIGGEIDPTTLNIALNLLIDQISVQLEDSVIEGKRYIALDDFTIIRLEAIIDVELDFSQFSGLLQGQGIPSLIVLNLEFSSDLDQINGEFSIEAPAEWQDEGTISLVDVILEQVQRFSASEVPASEGGPVSDAEAEFDIAYGGEATGTLDAENNLRDTYQLSAQQGDEITITLRTANANSDLDTIVFLLAENGDILAVNDDADDREGGLGIFDSRIKNFTIPEDGTYLIQVESVFINRDGDYRLLVEKR